MLNLRVSAPCSSLEPSTSARVLHPFDPLTLNWFKLQSWWWRLAAYRDTLLCISWCLSTLYLDLVTQCASLPDFSHRDTVSCGRSAASEYSARSHQSDIVVKTFLGRSQAFCAIPAVLFGVSGHGVHFVVGSCQEECHHSRHTCCWQRTQWKLVVERFTTPVNEVQPAHTGMFQNS